MIQELGEPLSRGIFVFLSIWLLASFFICFYWAIRPAEWFWWKHKYIHYAIEIGGFLGCVGIIWFGVQTFLWFIPDALWLGDRMPSRSLFAGAISFCGTVALWFGLDIVRRNQRQKNREERIESHKQDYLRMINNCGYSNSGYSRAIEDFQQKERELDKLSEEGKLGPYREDRLIALKSALAQALDGKNSLTELNEKKEEFKNLLAEVKLDSLNNEQLTELASDIEKCADTVGGKIAIYERLIQFCIMEDLQE